jgi:hypothetical protein
VILVDLLPYRTIEEGFSCALELRLVLLVELELGKDVLQEPLPLGLYHMLVVCGDVEAALLLSVAAAVLGGHERQRC